MSIPRGTPITRTILTIAARLLPAYGGAPAIAAHLRQRLGHPPTPRNVWCWLETELVRRDPLCDPDALYAAADAACRAEQRAHRRIQYRANPAGEAPV